MNIKLQLYFVVLKLMADTLSVKSLPALFVCLSVCLSVCLWPAVDNQTVYRGLMKVRVEELYEKSLFSYASKWNYTYGCTIKQSDIFKVKSSLDDSVFSLFLTSLMIRCQQMRFLVRLQPLLVVFGVTWHTLNSALFVNCRATWRCLLIFW
jgi:hypothetical protein